MDDAPDDELPLWFNEPRLTLDSACPTCHGTGVMTEGGRSLECTCLLRQRVLHYLTPQYGPAISWNPNFPAEPYRHKDVFIENTDRLPVSQFRELAFAAVKSFLLVTGQQFSHRTLRPYEIFRQLFNTTDTQTFDDLSKRVQLLVFLFGGDDAPRSSYQTQIPWLIRLRRDHGVCTWLISTMPVSSSLFNERYPGVREPLLDCIKDGFVTLSLSSATAR